MRTKVLLYILIFTSWHNIRSQDIDALAKSRKEWLAASGGLQLMQIYNQSKDRTPSRKPYSYIFTANLDLKLLGFIDAPFQAVFSNLGNRLTQPTFNQTSIHPKYKWLQVHLGTISVNYSSHTMGGLVFNGVAADLTPGKVSIGLFAGKFKKAIQPTGTTDNDIEAAYSRNGMGGKLGFSSRKTTLEVNYLFAGDNPTSLEFTGINMPKPQQNHAGGIVFKQQLNHHLSIDIQHSLSYLIQDMRSEKNPISGNPSAALFKATKAAVAYRRRVWQTAIMYEKTDPGYRSLGAYYFNNDLENITLQLGGRLFRNKVIWNTRGGLQRNNLDGKRMDQMLRYVGSAQVQIQLGANSSGNFSYSNFNSYSNARNYTEYLFQNNPYLAWDTLNFRQVSQNISANLNSLFLESRKLKHSINVNGMWQQSSETRNGNNKISSFNNVALGYYLQKTKAWAIFLGMNMAQHSLGGIQTKTAGPVGTLGIPFLKNAIKWNTTVAYTTGEQPVALIRSFVRWSVSKTHNLSVSFQRLQKKLNHETTLTLVYTASIGG